MLAELWCEVLGVGRVGLYDNFFDLGGHSLALVKLQRMIEARLQLPVDVVDLFRHPTVSAFASHLSGGDRAKSSHTGLNEQKRAALGRARLDAQRERAMQLRRRKT